MCPISASSSAKAEHNVQPKTTEESYPCTGSNKAVDVFSFVPGNEAKAHQSEQRVLHPSLVYVVQFCWHHTNPHRFCFRVIVDSDKT